MHGKDTLGNDIQPVEPEVLSQLNINDLPQEILVEVFSNLELVQLSSLRLVCKYWNYVVSDPSIWEKSFRSKFGSDEIFPSFARTRSWIVEYLSRMTNLKAWKKSQAQHITYQVVNEVFVGDNEFGLTNFYSDRLLTYSPINNNITICSLHNGRNQTFIPGNHYSIRCFSVNWNYLVFATNIGGLYIKNLITSTNSGSSRHSLKEIKADTNEEFINSIDLNLDFDKNKVRLDIITGSSTGKLDCFNLDGQLIKSFPFNDAIFKVKSDFKNHILAITTDKLFVIDFQTFQVRQCELSITIDHQTIIDFDFGDGNLILCSGNKIRVINFSDETIFIRTLDLPIDIKLGKMQKQNLKPRREKSLVGEDGLYYANVLEDESVIIWNIREPNRDIVIRRQFDTEFKYKSMRLVVDNDKTINAIELNSSVIVVGGYNGFCNIHDVFTGKVMREASVKFPKKYPYMVSHKIPVREIHLNESSNMTNGVIMCADLVQYFQFGNTERDKLKDKKKKLANSGEALRKAHQSKKAIKDQLDDYDIEEHKKDQLEKLFDKYNGNEYTSEDELSIAIALSQSANTSRSEGLDDDEEFKKALELSKQQKQEEFEDEELKRALELSKLHESDNLGSLGSLINPEIEQDEEDEELKRILELSKIDM